MNRRDQAIVEHLDAMESRMVTLFAGISTRLDTIVEAIADLRVDLIAHIHDNHAHGEDS